MNCGCNHTVGILGNRKLCPPKKSRAKWGKSPEVLG